MERVLEFLKENPIYMLATMDGDQPRVRPFGTMVAYQGRLYFQTGKSKKVYEQMKKNPRVELCAMGKDMTWLRVWATAVEDDSEAAANAVLDCYPHLRKVYTPGDGNCTTFYLKDATAAFCAMGKPDETITF